MKKENSGKGFSVKFDLKSLKKTILDIFKCCYRMTFMSEIRWTARIIMSRVKNCIQENVKFSTFYIQLKTVQFVLHLWKICTRMCLILGDNFKLQALLHITFWVNNWNSFHKNLSYITFYSFYLNFYVIFIKYKKLLWEKTMFNNLKWLNVTLRWCLSPEKDVSNSWKNV